MRARSRCSISTTAGRSRSPGDSRRTAQSERSVPALALGVSALSLLLGLLLFVLATGRVRAPATGRGEDPPARPPGAPRRADRPAQPRARARPRRAAAGPQPAPAGPGRRGALRRHRRLQDGQRHATATPPATASSRSSPTRCARSCATATPSGRLGGDEFVVLLEARRPRPRAELVAERADRRAPRADRARTTREPPGLGHREHRHRVGRSRDSADELLRDADFALYEAKARARTATRSSSRGCRPRSATGSSSRLDLATALEPRRVLPPVPADLRPGDTAVTGRRGAHPLAAPHARRHRARTTFIPLAEETGLIVRDRPLGARRGVPASGRVARARPHRSASRSTSRRANSTATASSTKSRARSTRTGIEPG